MIYFNSKYLSQCLNINLAKWKRWVREFLAPDPLSGMQSGYARNLNLKDAFYVYLAGYLVSELKYGIVQARQLMTVIEPVLKERGFQALYTAQRPDPSNFVWVLISPLQTAGYNCIQILQSGTPRQDKGKTVQTESSLRTDESIGKLFLHENFLCAHLLSITRLYNQFIDLIESKERGAANQI